MKKEFFNFPSSFQKKEIHAVIYRPDGEVKGLLQVIHGYAEHIERYDAFMRYMADNGYVVFGDDHLGHGYTAKNENELSNIGTYDAVDHVLNDEVALNHLIKAQYDSSLPCYILGHSMGSLILRGLLGKYPDLCDKAIIMGTGDMTPALLNAFHVILGFSKLFHKGDYRSKTINNLALNRNDTFFKDETLPNCWLSANQDNVKRYNADPLSGKPGSLYTYDFLLKLMRLIRQPEHLQKMNQDLPVLFVSGADDAFGNFGKGLHIVIDLFKKAGMKYVQYHLYPNMRHEILNETEHDKVYQDILHFLTA